MHWIDVIVLMVILAGTAIGYKRGLILELTDLAIGFFGGLLAFRGCGPLGGFFSRIFKAFPESTSESISFWILLLFAALMVLSAGLHIDRATREQDRLSAEVRNYGGLIVALLKTLILSSLICAYIPYADGLTSAEKTAVRKAASSQLLHGLNTPVGVLVGLVTPENIAKKFHDSMK